MDKDILAKRIRANVAHRDDADVTSKIDSKKDKSLKKAVVKKYIKDKIASSSQKVIDTPKGAETHKRQKG